MQQNTQKNLKSSNFRIVIDRLPNTVWYANSVSLPGISSRPANVSSYLKNIPVPSEKASYSSLVIEFIIDETLSNYFELKNWIDGLYFPKNTNQYKNLKNSDKGLYSDIAIIIMSNTNNPAVELKFTKCFPTNLRNFDLDTRINANQILTCGIEFEFLSYEHAIINSDFVSH